MEERIIELEARLAHQERTLEEVNEVITRQQGEIDRLQARMEAIVKHLRDAGDDTGRLSGAGD